MPRQAKPNREPILQRSPAAREELRQALGHWFQQHGRDLPWRHTHDPYAILISELMLQQTQVATVQPYFVRWLQLFPSFAVLAAAPEDAVLHAWQGLGYYARARNLHAAAKAVVERHGGVLPDDPAAIAGLPGVGRYTAGALASFAFDRPAAAVDANIARVLARLFTIAEPIDTTAGTRLVWAAAEQLLPGSGGCLHTSALMELGALICLPRQPQCLVCPARAWCAGQGAPELFPTKKPRRATVELEENCRWSVREGAVLLEQQTGPRWRGLWKLPRLAEAPAGEPLWETTYPFTHHRVRLRVYGMSPPAELATGQCWAGLDKLGDFAFPSPHRRAVLALQALAWP